jgi:hypothetical protein
MDKEKEMLTDTQKKALTEMLGEKWNEWEWQIKEQDKTIETPNRTFTTWQDFIDVVRAIGVQNSIRASGVNRLFDLFNNMQQPDFIEQFMRAVAEMKGVKE